MFLSVTLLKMGLQVRGVARVREDSPAKSTNGVLVRRKTKVLPDSALCLEPWFHDLVEFVQSASLYTCRQKLRLSIALSDNH